MPSLGVIFSILTSRMIFLASKNLKIEQVFGVLFVMSVDVDALFWFNGEDIPLKNSNMN